MGTLFSTFNIAQSGMSAAQIMIEVSGHNIANVNTEGYTRQRAQMVAQEPLVQPYGVLGRGVAVVGVERLRETFLDEVYRQQSPALGSAEVRASYFARIEDLFQEPGENGFGTQIDAFFDSLHDFAGNVEELPVRMSVITEAQNICSSLNLMAGQIYALRTNANEEVSNMVPEINSISQRIAALNETISAAEAGGGAMNDLRDERDLLLDQLSSFVDITARERTDGQVDVLIGVDPLVEGASARQLVAKMDPSLDPSRPDLFRVVFADSGMDVNASSGKLYGALTVRDGDLVDLSNRIDELAGSLISAINSIHSSANGLDNWTSVTGANQAANPAAALVSGGLPFDVQAGTLQLSVYNNLGVATTRTLTIDGTTSLNDLAAAIDAVPSMSATVTSDGQLQVQSNAGFSFSFSNDHTGALVALGVNGLFTGSKAGNIAVNQDIVDNPRLLASGYSTDILNTGDNTAALAMANVRTAVLIDNTATIGDYYETTIVRVGVHARANDQVLKMEQAFVDDFERRRQEVSGVSLDEEVANMLQYQRAYEASARVITVVDRMIEALLNAFA